MGRLPVAVGDLRHRVTLVIAGPPGSNRDARGQPHPTYTPAGEFWAQVRPLTAREATIAGGAKAVGTLVVGMRHGEAGVTNRDRFVFEGRTLEIQGILNVDGRSRRVDYLCTEIQP